MQFAIFGETDP